MLTQELPEETGQRPQQTEGVSTEPVEQEETPLPKQLPVPLSQEEQEALAQHNADRHEWIEQLGAQDRGVTHRC